jgi:hypothetical protein
MPLHSFSLCIAEICWVWLAKTIQFFLCIPHRFI